MYQKSKDVSQIPMDGSETFTMSRAVHRAPNIYSYTR